MQKKRKHPVILTLLWVVFLVMVAGVVYLSFQDGREAKTLGKQFIEYIARFKYPEREATAQEFDTLTYEVRQAGRVCAFFLIGILGTTAVHMTCKKSSWIIKTIITAVVLVAIAYLTEKLKIYIPTRHYSYEEMMLSIAAVGVGFLLVSVVTLTVQALKSFFRLMTAVR